MFHRLEHRGIGAHVLIYWLALLLTRVAEPHTDQTWPPISTERSLLQHVSVTGDAGAATHTTTLTGAQAGPRVGRWPRPRRRGGWPTGRFTPVDLRAGRLTRSARRWRLGLPSRQPWHAAFATTLARLRAALAAASD